MSTGAMHATTPSHAVAGSGRLAAALGALQGALGVVLGALAAHVAADGQVLRLGLAALTLVLHAVLLIALAGRRWRWLGWVRVGVLVGSCLFAGSLVASAMLGWPPRLAPLGGACLIAAWLLLAVGVWRGLDGRA